MKTHHLIIVVAALLAGLSVMSLLKMKPLRTRIEAFALFSAGICYAFSPEIPHQVACLLMSGIAGIHALAFISNPEKRAATGTLWVSVFAIWLTGAFCILGGGAAEMGGPSHLQNEATMATL